MTKAVLKTDLQKDTDLCRIYRCKESDDKEVGCSRKRKKLNLLVLKKSLCAFDPKILFTGTRNVGPAWDKADRLYLPRYGPERGLFGIV